MNVDRRGFIKGAVAGCGAIAAGGGVPGNALARDNLPISPEALGLLYDSTLCIGCKACMSACKTANSMPTEFSQPEPMWDTPLDLSGKTKTVIQVYKNGKGALKDREQDGFAFTKKSCLHCVDPSCVSVCPVSAMLKDAKTGIVTNNPDSCIGCRYCVAACPFGVPRFQYDTAVPRIKKCELCNHLRAEGHYSACATVCPTGATLYGPVSALLTEAKRRLAGKPGTEMTFPRGQLNSGDSHNAKLGSYIPKVYGEKELGGTQMLLLAGIPFANLGYPELPERSYAAESETLQHTLYQGMILPLVAFAGLLHLVKRSRAVTEEEHPTATGDQ